VLGAGPGSPSRAKGEARPFGVHKPLLASWRPDFVRGVRSARRRPRELAGPPRPAQERMRPGPVRAEGAWAFPAGRRSGSFGARARRSRAPRGHGGGSGGTFPPAARVRLAPRAQRARAARGRPCPGCIYSISRSGSFGRRACGARRARSRRVLAPDTPWLGHSEATRRASTVCRPSGALLKQRRLDRRIRRHLPLAAGWLLRAQSGLEGVWRGPRRAQVRAATDAAPAAAAARALLTQAPARVSAMWRGRPRPQRLPVGFGSGPQAFRPGKSCRGHCGVSCDWSGRPGELAAAPGRHRGRAPLYGNLGIMSRAAAVRRRCPRRRRTGGSRSAAASTAC
jgi:hypothetical protein